MKNSIESLAYNLFFDKMIKGKFRVATSLSLFKREIRVSSNIFFAGNDQLKTNTALQMKDAGVEMGTV